MAAAVCAPRIIWAAAAVYGLFPQLITLACSDGRACLSPVLRSHTLACWAWPPTTPHGGLVQPYIQEPNRAHSRTWRPGLPAGLQLMGLAWSKPQLLRTGIWNPNPAHSRMWRPGLPVGLQLMGPAWSEPQLLRTGAIVEAAVAGKLTRPRVFYDILGAAARIGAPGNPTPVT